MKKSESLPDEEQAASSFELPPTYGMRGIWIFVGALLLAGVIFGAFWFHSWTKKETISASGGLYFLSRMELAAPHFFQGDERWRDDNLGTTDGTLGAEGCAVASAAMVLGSYGIDTDPGRLNAFLNTNSGYTEQGWIYWEKAAELAPDRVRHVYEDKPSYQLIDLNLLKKNPVIVRLRYPGGTTHFVVIVGKEGLDYLIRDPGRGGAKGVYPLKEFGSPIEALRYYQKL